MSVERMKFSDLNGQVETSFGPNKRGCFVTVVSGFILALLALVIAVGVGIIVHFASSGKTIECQCSYRTDNGPSAGGEDAPHRPASPEAIWQNCINISAARNECLSAPHCPGMGLDLTTVAPTPKPMPVDVRLPNDTWPQHYNVELQPYIYSDDPDKFTFDGKVEIYLVCQSPTNVVIVHINDLTVDNSTLEFVSATPGQRAPKWSHYETDLVRQFFKVYLSSDLIVGNKYILRIGYSGPLKDDLMGLYKSSYKEGNTTKWLAATQFQPTDARKAFPCYDEPAIKATFNITLVRKQHMQALSNMPKVASHDRGDGWIADDFDTTVKMSTYLLAMVICDYRYREAHTSTGVKFRVWARPEAIGQVDYALDIGVRILEYFEEYFDIQFPLPKQDMIAIPDFAAGAMENWGLITYRETALLFDPEVSSTANKQRVAVVVSHELAHQWFGNLVTPSWWDDLWLNEGFASYVEYLGVDHVHPDWLMMQQFLTEDLQDVFTTDGLGTSHPIYVPVNHPDEINEIFDKISYGKGATVIRMMNNFLGETTFRKGLTKYLQRHQYGNAHHTDLWKTLKEQAEETGPGNVDVKEVMDTWVLQMGYPVVTIVRNPQRNDTADARQEHFLLDKSQPPTDKYPAPFQYEWMVPLTYTTSVNPNWDNPILTWMERKDVSLTGVPTSARWLIGNVKQVGYYRVNYDSDNWEALIDQLKLNHHIFPVSNRAQLIDDAFNLGRSGTIDQVVGLKATEYLVNEENYLPWESASVNLGYIDDMLARTAAYGLFKKYMLHQITPAYNRLGWEIAPDDQHLQKYMRLISIGYACKYGNKQCLNKASQLYEWWMSAPDTNKISPDLRTLVYCNGIRNGGQREWDFAYERYRTANVASEKDKLLYALSCTSEPWLLSRYLMKTMNTTEIRKQDAIYTVVYISRNNIGRYLAWDFLRGSWKAIRARFGGGFFAMNRLVSGVTATFNTNFELQQLKDFLNDNSELGTASRAFTQSIEKTKVNIKWRNANERHIHDWLEDIGSRIS